MASFAALEDRVTGACIRHLANVTLLRAIGEPFDAMFALAEKNCFDTARVTTHTARYLGAELVANDLLTIAAGPYAGDYKVIGQPMQINGGECQADLVKQ